MNNPEGGRFIDATDGAYYAAENLPTAVAETSHQFARLAAGSADPPRYGEMRAIIASIDADLHDAAQLDVPDRQRALDRNDYTFSQAFALALRASVEPTLGRSASMAMP